MAQYVFWNWQDDDSTKNLNHRTLGVLDPGRYRGFDTDLNTPGGLTLRLHQNNGVLITNYDTPTYTTERRGVILTKQGAIIHENSDIDLVIAAGDTTNPRIDLVVCEHEYVDVQGASVAIYSIIQGIPSVNPLPPSIPQEQIKIVLGQLLVPANATDLSNAIYTQAPVPTFSLDPNIMKTNEVQTSIKEKTFNLIAYEPKELIYDNTTDPLVPFLKPSTDGISNMWYFGTYGNPSIEIKSLIVGAYNSPPSDISQNKKGRIHRILFLQDCTINGNLGNILFTGGTNSNLPFKVTAGDTLTLLDATELLSTLPPSYPIYFVIDGQDISWKKENGYTKAQWFSKQSAAITPDANGILALDGTGNFTDIEVSNTGADIKYITDVSSRKFGINAPSNLGGGFLFLRIKQPIGSNNTILYHASAAIYTHKPIWNNYGANVVLNNGDLLLLVEDELIWRLVAVYNDTNPFSIKDFINTQASLNTTFNNFISNNTSENWKLIGTGGTMANGQYVPNYNTGSANTGGTLQPLRLRRINNNYIHLQGHTTNSIMSYSVPFAIVIILPIGYRPPNDITNTVIAKDNSNNPYLLELSILTNGTVIVGAFNGEFSPSGGTYTINFPIDLIIPIL